MHFQERLIQSRMRRSFRWRPIGAVIVRSKNGIPYAIWYRAKGVTEIVTVPRIERWEDLDQHASDFAGTTFDRVIIVGHGALDGPLTRGDVSRTIENSRIVEQWTLQPGVVFEYSTTYLADFADFVDSNRETLLTQYDSVTDTLFEQVTQQQQDDYDACAQRVWDETEFANCEQGCDVTCETFEGQERNVNCFDGCFNQCTDDYINELAGPACSPIQNEFSETVDEDAYNKFAGSLASLTADDGLIFLGFCNAATDAYDATVVNELSGLRSYTDLIASTTGRHASGPIGKTSGQDIIDRVTRMEKDRDQKYLYIAAPPKP